MRRAPLLIAALAAVGAPMARAAGQVTAALDAGVGAHPAALLALRRAFDQLAGEMRDKLDREVRAREALERELGAKPGGPGAPPIGTIVPYWCWEAPCPAPTGWERCDGEEVTTAWSPFRGQRKPDLAGRFIKAVSDEAIVGAAGGGDTAGEVTLATGLGGVHGHSVPKGVDKADRIGQFIYVNDIYPGSWVGWSSQCPSGAVGTCNVATANTPYGSVINCTEQVTKKGGPPKACGEKDLLSCVHNTVATCGDNIYDPPEATATSGGHVHDIPAHSHSIDPKHIGLIHLIRVA